MPNTTDLTIELIAERLEEIRASAEYDQEDGHILQDKLYVDFIRYVAEVGPMHLAKRARAVLAVNDIEFTRWYA